MKVTSIEISDRRDAGEYEAKVVVELDGISYKATRRHSNPTIAARNAVREACESITLVVMNKITVQTVVTF